MSLMLLALLTLAASTTAAQTPSSADQAAIKTLVGDYVNARELKDVLF